MWRKYADIKVSEKIRGRCASDTRAETLFQPMVKTMVTQVVLLHPIEVHSREDIQPTVHGKPALKQVPGRIYDPMKRTLKQVCWICDPMRDLCWSSWILKDCTPWKGPTLEQFLKSCNLWEGPILEKFMKDSILHVPTSEQRNSIRTKEWQKRSFMNWL